MGARVSASAKRIAVERLHVAGSDESEFDLDEEEKRIKDLQDKNKQVVTYVVENLFPYAPVSIKIQRLDTLAVDSTTEIASPAKEKQHRMHSYLWITLDDLILKQQNVPLDATISYPLVVAIDNAGNAYVTDRNNGQRKLKSSDLLALATAKVPPLPPDPVRWKESNGSIVDRFEVQYKPWNDLPTLHKPWQVLLTSLMPSHSTLSDLSCHSAFAFRAKCHNPAGWSEYSAVTGPFSTLAGVAAAPTPPFAAVVSDTFISVGWSAVADNGSPVQAYHLEMKPLVDATSPYTAVLDDWAVGYLVPGLTPKSIYMFRLKAVNGVGETSWVESKPVRTKEFARPERTDEVPPEVLAARQGGAADAEDSREMAFRKKRFHFHRELRLCVPPQTAPFEVTLARPTMFADTVARFHRASKKELQHKPRFLGKAIFDRQVVRLPLAPVLYKHLVGLAISWDDFVGLDPQFSKSLHWIQHNDVTDVLYETFSITRSNNIIVIDVDLLRCNVHFQGGYDATAQVILWLWQALRAWDNSTRQMFLQFATGSPAMPLDGFDPPLTITKSDLEATALPRSHTCFNQLVLPEYQSFSVLSAKLVFAMQNTEGFELS
ncbi:hypothetical protein DYB38_005057 [Aphanomyces astaci]|uniref:HECT-type E3 ubiquitin transferase n=1 Tax=Aphanomyces astaci TaxID=112090 RepID=A0A397CE26_APHAT|nr:hypothetical protein DYB38_005057 [Aphanomyces astaci]